MNLNNRINLRYSFVERVVLVTPAERQVILDSENISTGGVFLITNEPLPVGTCGFLKVTVCLSDMKKEINSKFIVSHITQSDVSTVGMGVEFIGMPEDDKVLLEELVNQVSGIT